MYLHKKYTNSIKKKASSSISLSNRLDVNKKYSKKDLTEWLFSKYRIKKNFKILEVGAGLGQHVLKESKIISSNGYILAVDNSKKSILNIKRKKLSNVEVKCLEMDTLPNLLDKKKIKFDRIISSYAIYYSNNPILLIKKLFKFLKPGGEMILTVPNTPHTLIDLIISQTRIPINVVQSLFFGQKILKPFLIKNYKSCKIFDFKNELKIRNFNDLYNLYKSSTFYIKEKEVKIKNFLFKSYSSKTKNKNYFLLKKSALTFIVKKIK